MCKCTPEIRTPFCGKGDCQWLNKLKEGGRSEEKSGLELIICAAVRYGEKVWMGHRHCHCIVAMRDELSYTMNRRELSEIHSIDGFVTSTGRFVDREEAMEIHKKSGKKPRAPYEGSKLFSENIY